MGGQAHHEMRIDMDQTKKWFESAGVWGGIVAAIAGGAGLLGYTITPEDQAQIASTASKVAELVVSFGALGGGILSIFGRVRASKSIKSAP